MKRFSLISRLTLFFLCCATTAGAHHSFAMFDRSRTETVAGTVKEFELINPHGWLRIMVADTNGVASEWPLELGARASSRGLVGRPMRFIPATRSRCDCIRCAMAPTAVSSSPSPWQTARCSDSARPTLHEGAGCDFAHGLPDADHGRGAGMESVSLP